MKKPKQQSDVKGVVIGCPNFEACTFCYGCRNYNSADIACTICEDNRKHNICNTEKHRSDLISKMVQRNTITL